MKLIAQIQLQPSLEQHNALLRTIECANAACNEISRIAWEQQVFGKYDLQQLVYLQIKASYGLSAQMVIRCIAKVGDSYKLDRKTQRTYRAHGSIAYDDRILSFQLDHRSVSIWTVDRRERSIPFVCGERQAHMLQTRQGESDLVFRNGTFYLLVTCTIDEPTPDEVDAALGIDLGIVNLATDSDGEVQSGALIEKVRQKQSNRRSVLQQVGTRSAKRRLKNTSGRQRRFQTDTNHCIAKRLVQKAKDTQRMLVLEDLKHIRTRTTVRKSGRARHRNWAFAQLRAFIHYKAVLAGVQVRIVDPSYTSRTCSQCGFCDERNRVDQATFHCLSCSFHSHADVNAACNIRDWVAVIPPMVSGRVPAGLAQKQAAPL